MRSLSEIKSKTFDILNLLSNYRTSLMGFAILWIVLFHCDVNTRYNLNYLYSFPLLKLGYSGYDIFMFVSGFGIYYSLNKAPDNAVFLLKRLIRFLPAAPIIILYIIYSKITSFHVIVGFFTFQNVWIKDGFLSYLSYAFFFYLLSPVIKNIIDCHIKQDIYKMLLLLIILFFFTIPWWYRPDLYGISRILIYTFGMFLGYYYCNKIKINKLFCIALIIFSILGFMTLVIVSYKYFDFRRIYGLLWYPELFFIPGLCFVFVFVAEILKKYLNIPLKILNILGKYSITIYCIDFFLTQNIKINTFWLHFFLSIFVGIIYGFSYDKIKLYIKSIYNGFIRIK